jgi:hypothetical protein
MLDNFEHVLKFCPDKDDGDTFIYTEMLNRGVKKGNNGQRMLKTFYHRSKEEFTNQYPTIKKLCDISGVRACTRVSPRSYKKVAKQFLRLVTETYITENYNGMKTLYNRACGITVPEVKLWLWDIDVVDEETLQLGVTLTERGYLRDTIPSKKGLHYITGPFDIRGLEFDAAKVSIHKDNPTNLYIPDGAD